MDPASFSDICSDIADMLQVSNDPKFKKDLVRLMRDTQGRQADTLLADIRQEEERIAEQQRIARLPEDLLLHGVETLEMSVRLSNCLTNMNISTLAELVTYSESDLLSGNKNFGRKCINELRELLADKGLALATRSRYA